MPTKTCLEKILKVECIHLKDRVDRLFWVKKNFNFNFSLFDAVRGLDCKSIPELSLGEAGCLWSHYGAWKANTEQYDDGNVIFLEDDANPRSNFLDLWNNEISHFIPKDFNIIYLGGNLESNNTKYHLVREYYNKYFFNIRKNNLFRKTNYWHMTSLSYVLNIKSMKYLLSKFDSIETYIPLDHFLTQTLYELDPSKVYHSDPVMFNSRTSQSSIIHSHYL